MMEDSAPVYFLIPPKGVHPLSNYYDNTCILYYKCYFVV